MSSQLAALPETISSFITKHTLSSVCFVTAEGSPHCISCFYAFHEKTGTLIYKSSKGTLHDDLVLTGAPVSGTILTMDKSVFHAKWIQLWGRLLAEADLTALQKALYLKAFPIALGMPGYNWGIAIDKIKFTDNTIKIGHKEHWERA